MSLREDFKVIYVIMNEESLPLSREQRLKYTEPIKRKIRSNLPIIFENSEIIVINKPSGLLSVPSDKEKGSTAYRMVSDYVQQKDKHNR